ncbi:uncharacterized protein fam83ga [Silurus meridionalis]|uniref:Scaffolding anchor of CK1 domain-containing protein n=1 Tax=Silurus meridionalis TaxID=175797 RepID=A0A8T0AHU1_SILME|nr:uncharacterized protein fam83ga [Silurus meridionalis]KAF7691122.1 hypothetical protein HF521_011419 [Silurus meridionalis]
MALSQIQCLNEYHVNLRTNESKPEFLYSEEQRLALEKLLDEGPDCFHEFIKTNQIRPFLSDLELAHLSASVEQYCPDLPGDLVEYDGDSKGTRLSLQYWPERSDDSLPQLELGWPQRASYRGVTRVSVHAQPPLHGDPHVKEVIRRTIAQAQKVIAVVMDLFTDVDIFKDLLHASFKRNVAVYIILEVTGVPHFLKMCESATMHTGHLKNLRVRSIRGNGFFTHLSKRVCGSQSQKFMFIDGDKAISGSYSFTWSASRLDRSIITVLTGQAVDYFDQLFQDLYMMSNPINLNKIKLEKEQTLKPISKAAPVLLASATLAHKLINPKYALVFGTAAAKSNQVDSKMCTQKNNNNYQITEMSEGPHIHPGLLHLEKANMIDYLPVWPEPDPPIDVIGFINIRDCNKPLQAHLTRSELFEVSQAIRFKDPLHVPQNGLSEQVCPRPTFPIVASTNKPPLVQPKTKLENDKLSSLQEQVVYMSHIQNPAAAYCSKKDEKDSFVMNGMLKQTDISSTQREETSADSIIITSASVELCKDSEMSKNLQIHNSFYTDAPNIVTTHTPVAQDKTTLNGNSCETIGEIVIDNNIRDNGQNTHKPIEPDKNETDRIDCTIDNGQRAYSNSTSSFSSDEYFECSESLIVDSDIVGMVNRMPAVSQFPDEPDTSKENLSSFMFGSCENSTNHEAMKETESFVLMPPEERNGQNLIGASTDKLSALDFTSVNGGNCLSESVSMAHKEQIHETDSMLQQIPESKLLLEVKTDAQVAAEENTECPQQCESYSEVNRIADIQPVQGNHSAESQLLLFKPLLQDKVSVPYMPVQKIAEAQCIVFSDTVNKVPLLRLRPDTCQRFNCTCNLKSAFKVNDDTHLTPQSKPVSLNTGFLNSRNTVRSHKEDFKLPFQNKLLIARESKLKQDIKVKDIHSSSSEMKECATPQNVDKAQQIKLKTLSDFKARHLRADILPVKRKTQVHMCVREEHKNQSEMKPKLQKNFKQLNQVSPRHKQFPANEVRLTSAKVSISKLHSNNHLSTFDVSMPGVQNDPPERQLSQNRAANDLHATPAKLPRRHTVPTRSNQTRFRPLRTDLSAYCQCSSQKQPQAQQDRMRVNQLHQTSFRQHYSSATEDRSYFRGTLFPNTLRTMRTTAPSSQMKQKKSIKEPDEK